MSDTLEESDRIEGLPHPRETYDLIGHDHAEQTFLADYASGKFAHAWLISGPPGVGKATFAYRIARHLLAEEGTEQEGTSGEDRSLHVSPEAHVAHLVESQGHPNLLVLRRTPDPKTKKMRSFLTVDETRKIHSFFGLAAGHPGWRICIIDTADDMNANAANALLKTLEEPPEKSLLIVLAHAPGRLLPTIRSRCRHLRLNPLSDAHVTQILHEHFGNDLDASQIAALAHLAEGSAGRALQLAQEGGLELYHELLHIIQTLPEMDSVQAMSFSGKYARAGAEQKFRLVFDLLSDWLQRLVRYGSHKDLYHHPDVFLGEHAVMDKLLNCASPTAWADIWDEMQDLYLRSRALHLDSKQTLMQAFFMMEKACHD